MKTDRAIKIKLFIKKNCQSINFLIIERDMKRRKENWRKITYWKSTLQLWIINMHMLNLHYIYQRINIWNHNIIMILARNTETRLFYRMIIRGIIFAFEIKYNVTKWGRRRRIKKKERKKIWHNFPYINVSNVIF